LGGWAKAVLAAGYNFSLLLRWLAELLRILFLLITSVHPIAAVA
jgi:hypothetical protein